MNLDYCLREGNKKINVTLVKSRSKKPTHSIYGAKSASVHLARSSNNALNLSTEEHAFKIEGMYMYHRSYFGKHSHWFAI